VRLLLVYRWHLDEVYRKSTGLPVRRKSAARHSQCVISEPRSFAMVGGNQLMILASADSTRYWAGLPV
jgi:hypothetical protein